MGVLFLSHGVEGILAHASETSKAASKLLRPAAGRECL